MPPGSDDLDPTTDPDDPAKAGGGDGFFRFLRCSYIFTSVVREVLEERLLREIGPYRLTPSQFHLVKLMSFDGHHQVGEVADFLGVSPPAASKNIDKLERLGLVVRTPSKGDRRATLLSVSRKGRRLVRKYEDLRAARLGPVLKGFGPEEVEQLTGLLERFAVSLLEAAPTADRFCLRCGCCIQEDCSVGQMRGGCPYQAVFATRRSEGPAAEVR